MKEFNLVKQYRKIPSTKFLYEISRNGNLRNVKSKKVIQKKYIENITELVEEAWGKKKCKRVRVNNMEFDSLGEACEYIKTNSQSNTSVKNILKRMSQKRKKILGCEIEYL